MLAHDVLLSQGWALIFVLKMKARAHENILPSHMDKECMDNGFDWNFLLLCNLCRMLLLQCNTTTI